jgi:hypothetical protein
MLHAIYFIDSTKPSPIGDDWKSWFLFYKWDVKASEGEIFLPVAPTRYRNLWPSDVLWFALDGVLLGYAKVLRVVDEGTQREVWYTAASIRRWSDVPKKVPWAATRQFISKVQGARWLAQMEKRP